MPTDREVGFCVDHSIKEVEALLPSSCHQRHDGPPTEETMNKLEAIGRLIQWAVKLSEFNIKYQLRHAIKA